MRLPRLGLFLLLLLLAGCRSGPAPEPAPRPIPPEESRPVALKLQPESGPIGTEVTVEIYLREPEKVRAARGGKELIFDLCWGPCGERSLSQSIWPKPSPDDPHRFTARVKVPPFFNSARLRKGELTLSLACAADFGPGCTGRPEAQARFALTDELPGVDWAALPTEPVQELPSLVRRPGLLVNPANPLHQAECRGGAVAPGYQQPPPHLRITTDGGASWEEISLMGVRIGQHAGMAGCRAFALDPHQPGVYYLAGSGHPAAQDEGAFPSPLHTVDNGQSWERVPVPKGFGSPESFLGFSTTAEGVTAWFGREEEPGAPPRVVGMATTDSGRSWQPVPLRCPEGPDCLWEIRSPLWSRIDRRLMRSEDGGATWRWAEWQGKPITTWPGRIQWLKGAIEAAEVRQGPDGEMIPLLRSTDGGRSWLWVDLPAPPGGWGAWHHLIFTADGSLLLRRGDQEVRLARGERAWAAK
ncbi:MAG: hypothetical protein ACOY93_09560 [Bacillota bacterium]